MKGCFLFLLPLPFLTSSHEPPYIQEYKCEQHWVLTSQNVQCLQGESAHKSVTVADRPVGMGASLGCCWKCRVSAPASLTPSARTCTLTRPPGDLSGR